MKVQQHYRTEMQPVKTFDGVTLRLTASEWSELIMSWPHGHLIREGLIDAFYHDEV